MSTLRPLYDRVIIKRAKAVETTKGGIIIPTTAQEKATEAEVVAVGKGKLLQDGRILEPSVKKGDKVLIGKYSGSEVKVDGEELVIIKEDEILGVLVNDK